MLTGKADYERLLVETLVELRKRPADHTPPDGSPRAARRVAHRNLRCLSQPSKVPFRPARPVRLVDITHVAQGHGANLFIFGYFIFGYSLAWWGGTSGVRRTCTHVTPQVSYRLSNVSHLDVKANGLYAKGIGNHRQRLKASTTWHKHELYDEDESITSFSLSAYRCTLRRIFWNVWRPAWVIRALQASLAMVTRSSKNSGKCSQ